MQVAHLDAVLGQELGQLLGHALGQRGHQHTLADLHARVDFRQQVVHLRGRRTHDDGRVDQPGRAHHLLHHLPGMLLLELRRCRRDKHYLAHLALELVELERPVVQRRRQAEAVLDQRGLARAVTVVHAVELADQHVRLVQEHQRIGRQVVDQRRRRLAGARAGQVARVVLDALAEAQLGEHFEIEAGTLLQPLRLDQPVFLVEELQPVAQFVLDRLDRAQHGLARRHVVARRVDREARDLLFHAAGQRIEELQRLHFVVEHLQPHRHLGVFRREDVDGVAAHAERAALEIGLVAGVLHGNQARDHVALADLVAGPQSENHLVVFVRVADTIDRRDRCHDHRVAALQQALGRRQPHLLDMLVDRRVLLDEQVALRDIGLRLVVVVVADEVLDRIAREELAELRVELCRQRLVGREHDRRPSHPGDHVGHGEGLARPGHAQQCLVRQAVLDPLHQLADRFRLVSGGRERLVQLERGAGKCDEFAFVQGRRGFCEVRHRGRNSGRGNKEVTKEVMARLGKNLRKTGGYARILGLTAPASSRFRPLQAIPSGVGPIPPRTERGLPAAAQSGAFYAFPFSFIADHEIPNEFVFCRRDGPA
ncbi:hypothetical protein D3C81_769030 [compost metagenome]